MRPRVDAERPKSNGVPGLRTPGTGTPATQRLSRREMLGELGLAGLALALAGCGTGSSRDPAAGGSTLRSSYVDPRGEGTLEVGPGVELIDRTELAPMSMAAGVLGSVAHLTDAHLIDEQSPARVPFLRRLGDPFNSTFRPQEALSAHVIDGAVRAVNAFAPDAVIQGGDLLDNVQQNELEQALGILRGAMVVPDSGTRGYTGVQSAGNPDPFYYRPDVDAPRHLGLLAQATRPFRAAGLQAPWHPVLGDHDLLVQGVLAPTAATSAIALGAEAIWELPANLRLPAGLAVSPAGHRAASPDSIETPRAIEQLIEQVRSAPAVAVPPDSSRREMETPEVLARIRAASGSGGSGDYMDYGFHLSGGLHLIVLDLVRREGGSGGLSHPGQEDWLAGELERAGDRWVLVFSHQPLTSSAHADRLLRLLDRHPRMLAAIWGHTHRNRILPRSTPAGGYWLIATCSLIDYPQEVRALRVRETTSGGVILETWMLDHVPDHGIGDVSRGLAYLDSQGGRPQGFAGGPLDRNVRLYKR